MPIALTPRRLSITAKSIALFSIYVLVLAAVYAAFSVYLVEREAAAVEDRLRQTARLVAAEVEAHLEAGRQRLATVAALPGLVYGLSRLESDQAEGHIPPWTTLHYLFFKSPVFTGGVLLLDDVGRVLWTEPPGLALVGRALTDDPVLAEVYRGAEDVISSGRPPGPVFDRPHVVVARAIRDPKGTIVGALAGLVDLTASEFTTMLSAVSTAEGRFARVTDAEGNVLASTSAPVPVATARLEPPVAPATALLTPPDRSADSPLLATASFAHSSWQVVAGQARAPALAGTRQLQRILFALGAGGLALAVAVGAWLIRRFTRRIERLTGHAQIMARGDLSQPLAVGGAYDELGTLARTFEHMRVQLQQSRAALEQRLEERDELIRLKEEFLANVSHELRTPLNVIIGYTDMLLDEADEGRDLLTRVRTQSERLLGLVRDLMTLSGSNTGKLALEVQPVAVPELLARLAPLADQLVQNKEVAVVWECSPAPPVLETDGRRLEQVLANLLVNACKFTPRGTVTVRARHCSEPDTMVFEVSDTGIGIPPEELPHIFDEFRQVDGSMTRRHDGIGLGLALVKKLTALLGGKVAVESRMGEGSRFTVTLPVRSVFVPEVRRLTSEPHLHT
jgi:signal transduction histidine kinase